MAKSRLKKDLTAADLAAVVMVLDEIPTGRKEPGLVRASSPMMSNVSLLLRASLVRLSMESSTCSIGTTFASTDITTPQKQWLDLVVLSHIFLAEGW